MEIKDVHIFKEPAEQKLGRQIKYVVTEKGCFECISHRHDRDRYARVDRKGREWLMHRYIYTITKGEIPKGMVIRHKCDNPQCINPEHLEMGTVKDNVRDKIERGRQPRVQRRIPEELKIQIMNDSRSAIQISITYGLYYHTVRNIKNQKFTTTSKPETKCHCKIKRRNKSKIKPNPGSVGVCKLQPEIQK